MCFSMLTNLQFMSQSYNNHNHGSLKLEKNSADFIWFLSDTGHLTSPAIGHIILVCFSVGLPPITPPDSDISILTWPIITILAIWFFMSQQYHGTEN